MPCNVEGRDDHTKDGIDCLHNTKVAEMLCSVMKEIFYEEDEGISMYRLSQIPGLIEWWDQHKRRDKQKEIKENAIKDKETS